MIDEKENATTAKRIAELIADRIISGALQPNAPLRQDHVAREFNSSHVPVREAFRQLEAQHLVVGVPRRGVRVRARGPRSQCQLPGINWRTSKSPISSPFRWS